MGFTQSAILGSCSFLLGMVFVCQIVDIPLLYMPVTQEALDNAYTFYGTWFEAPGAVKEERKESSPQALFHVALAIPMLALIYKLNHWTETAMFFDGSGVVLHLATIILYVTVHIQSLRTIFPDSTTTTSFSILPAPAPRETPVTETERIEAVRVLAAANALVGLLTLGVIGMQIGQEYARRVEEREQRDLDARIVSSATGESKKDL